MLGSKGLNVATYSSFFIALNPRYNTNMKIGEALVKEGLITRQQLSLALDRQVVFGGRIGTNLLELKVLDENDFTRFLSKYFDTPAVTGEVLTSIPREVLYSISRELIEKYKILPVKKDHRRLHTAMLNPRDIQEIDELRFITGFDIIPLVIAEIRLFYALEKFYGIRSGSRYASFFHHAGSEIETPDSVDQIKVAFLKAGDIEEIGDILIRAASKIAHRVALFNIRNAKISAWKTKGLAIEGFECPEGGIPLFSMVLKGRKYYRGPVHDEPANRSLVRMLAGTPQDVLILPITTKEEVTALLFINKGGDATLDANVVFLSRLASAASCAFEILTLKRRMSEI